MKLGNVSFGLGSLSVVASGVKTSTISTEPQLIALSTKGGFALTPAVTKAMGLVSGDNVIFINNIATVESEIASRSESIMQIVDENNLDLDNPEDVAALTAALSKWFIAKAYPLKSKTGAPIMVSARLTDKEKKELFDSQVDTIVAENRDALIAKFELAADSTDEEIKSHLSVDDLEMPKVQSYPGAKLASNGNAQGVGLKLNFSDTCTWEQLKADMEDKTAMKRVYAVDLAGKFVTKFNDGYEDVDVTVYPIGDYTDEKPIRVAKKDAEDAE